MNYCVAHKLSQYSMQGEKCQQKNAPKHALYKKMRQNMLGGFPANALAERE